MFFSSDRLTYNVYVYDGLGLGVFVKCAAWQTRPVQAVHRDKVNLRNEFMINDKPQAGINMLLPAVRVNRYFWFGLV